MTRRILPILAVSLAAAACDSAGAKPNGEATSAPATAAPATAAATAAATKARVVEVSAGEDGFKPSQIPLKQGEDVTLRFKRVSDKTCATEVVFPEAKIEKKLPLNEAVDIKVPTDKAQTLTFQCGMGMYKSKVVIAAN